MPSHFKYGDTREDGYRFRGLRESRPKKDGTYGNMVVAYKIKYPESLTDIQKETLKNVGL